MVRTPCPERGGLSLPGVYKGPRLNRGRLTTSPRHQSILVKNCKIWTDVGLREGSILIENGKIRKIARQIRATGASRIDSRRLVALPGLIDAHAHLRALGLRR